MFKAPIKFLFAVIVIMFAFWTTLFAQHAPKGAPKIYKYYIKYLYNIILLLSTYRICIAINCKCATQQKVALIIYRNEIM